MSNFVMSIMKDKGDSTTVISKKNRLPILKSSNLSEDEKNYFRSIFQKYDADGNGNMDLKELTSMLREDTEVSDKTVRKLMKYSDKNNDRKIDVDEFTEMVLDSKFKKLFEHYVNCYVSLVIPPDKRRKFKPVGRRDSETCHEENSLGQDSSSCYPPPICLVLVSIFQIICFILNQHNTLGQDDTIPDDVNGPIAQIFIYSPEKRWECWRFLTYMFVHIGYVHLTMNLITQTFLGIALELRNRWWRILTVYTAGVVAGSLVTSITDPSVYLAGASGGVYAIITAHLSNIIINWNGIKSAIQLFIFILLISADVATAIRNRYYLGDQTPIGYAAHFGGALAGFLVGLWILKNVEPTQKEKYLWWAAFIIYILLMGTAIILNVFWIRHLRPIQENT